MTKKSKQTDELFAPVDGELVNLKELPDQAFAEGMLGDGIAVKPASGSFVSPCDGVVSGVTESAHAYSITSADGLELLLHIGIDTVELKGEGFTPKVKLGDSLRKGDLIADVDLDFVKAKGYSTLTPLIVTNMEEVSMLERANVKGRVVGGKSVVMTVEKHQR